MNHEINRLIHFALQHDLISELDKDYAVNLLLDLFQLDVFTTEPIDEHLETAVPILENMLAWAVQAGLIEDLPSQKDRFDNRIMDCVMPRPQEVADRFNRLYASSPEQATDAFYQLSIASNYIRKTRTDRNIRWKTKVKYGQIEISINLSKPEKDPREIALAGRSTASHYPQCQLCKENVGFSGDLSRDARKTLRVIPLQLDQENYYLQYSPYVYYNEHCIVFNQRHQPMKIDRQTFSKLLCFVRQFPHYMIGSNADLPIVGGSILSHDHYQGGRYHFPIQDASVRRTLTFAAYPDLTVEWLNWPLTTIRLTSENTEAILDYAAALLECWRAFSCPELDILANSDAGQHNTITPIAFRQEKAYQLDLVLRNNRTSAAYPDGIFHPHPERHHIKKENIGLIEVMGLAILPGRLKQELQLLEAALCQQTDFASHDCLQKHQEWYHTLLAKDIPAKDVHAVIQDQVAEIFTQVLEDAGVFKLDDPAAEQVLIKLLKQAGGEQNVY